MIKNCEEFYEAILNNLTGGLVSVDIKGNVVYMNPMAYKILHIDTSKKILDAPYAKSFEDFQALSEVIKETIDTGKTVRRAEISIMHANVPLIIGYSTLMIKNSKNIYLGIAVIFQDISFVSATKK
ncbi:PAS domain-containing protein [Patescibacteria group bacterium]|nr:PAS domain-containing protein [Patescibacteria group bacterium]